MKKFILFARVYTCLIFTLPGAGWAQNTNPYPNYVVIGAFEHQNNAIHWTDDANKNSFPAKFEMNPNRNLYYVYVITTDDRKFAFAEALKLRTDTKYFDTWVYSGPLGVLGNRELANSGTEAQDFNPETGKKIESVESQSGDKQTGQADNLSNLQGNGQGEQVAIASDNLLSAYGTDVASTNKSNKSRKNNAKKKNSDAGVADGSGDKDNNRGLNADSTENISGQALAEDQGQSNQVNANSNTIAQPDQGIASDLSAQSGKKKRTTRKQAKNAGAALATDGTTTGQGIVSDQLNAATGAEEQSNINRGQDQNSLTGSSVDSNGQKLGNTNGDNGVSTNVNTKTPADNTGTVTDSGLASNTVDPATGKEQTSTTGANQNQAGVKGQTTKGQENAVAKNSNTKTATENAQANTDTGVASNTIDPVTGKELTSTTGANQNQAGVKGQTTKGQENAVAKNSNTKTATENAQANTDTGVASNTIDPVTG
ncbi:MAG: hypothetical protein WD824_25680, partial [Cyclobacteriaceae bacterium]